MLYTLRFFFSSKCSLFHDSNLFGSCIIHILYTECAKIKKNNNNSGAKGLTVHEVGMYLICLLLIGWKMYNIESGINLLPFEDQTQNFVCILRGLKSYMFTRWRLNQECLFP